MSLDRKSSAPVSKSIDDAIVVMKSSAKTYSVSVSCITYREKLCVTNAFQCGITASIIFLQQVEYSQTISTFLHNAHLCTIDHTYTRLKYIFVAIFCYHTKLLLTSEKLMAYFRSRQRIENMYLHFFYDYSKYVYT